MKAFFTRLAVTLLFLWQLPQHLLGLLLLGWYGFQSSFELKGNNHLAPSSTIFLSESMKGGISLGRFIILSDRFKKDPNTWYHERGHSIQSMYLGPLYLLIIGIPSLTWAILFKFDRVQDYYSFFTESWADRLGKVKRDKNG